MKLTFYHSRFCPRCARARKHLTALLGDTYHEHVAEVEILSHPLAAWKDGVRMVPALSCATAQLSGLWLSGKQIEQFLFTRGLLTDTGTYNQ